MPWPFGDIPTVQPAVLRAHRFHPLRLKVGEIVRFEKAMLIARKFQDRVRRRTFVESIASVLANAPQCRRQIRIAKELSHRRRFPIRQKYPSKSRTLREGNSVRLPVLSIRLRHRDAFVRQRRRWRNVLRHREFAETPPQRIPSRHRSRHSHGINACLGNLIHHSLRLQALDAHALRSPAAGVQAVQFLRLRVIDNRKQIAAHAIHHRFDHA